jgi:hypothetical protein
VDEPRRFFFVHLQKTGGTALFQRLRDGVGAAAVYPLPSDQSGAVAVTDVSHLIEQFQRNGAHLRVITGHFPLCTTTVLGTPFTTFTILRDPVERTLSLLRRRKLVEVRFKDLSLEQIYEDPGLQVIIRNHMVKMLSLTPDEMTTTPLLASVEFDAARLARAQRNLEHEIDVFGLQERFDAFCEQLSSRFGWDLGPARYANRTPRAAVSESLRERIAIDNQCDMELYRFAVDLYETQMRKGP